MEKLFLLEAVVMLSVPAVGRFMNAFRDKRADDAYLAGRFFELLALGYIFTNYVF